ncbi:DUF1127 domain-containing protein [Brucella cytisi]|uniref:YjiS-like domain-containing protein n=1 Tax=Brucella cytisi TaxID=407152 RepID=A0A1J6HYV4_9HYPH|nr:DUF1127 domain-containing protein [Brucella cytisi]OIS93407.1 hypothetical protein BLA27_10605 [Brucella cytisi]
MKWTEPMFYFRPQTETIDTILPVPVADSVTDLPKALQVNLMAASQPQIGYVRRVVSFCSYALSDASKLEKKSVQRTDFSAKTLRTFAGNALDWMSYRMMLRRSRIALGELTDDQLRDIGLQRDEAEREARKVRFHLR